MDVREKTASEKRLIDADTLLDEFLNRYMEMERKGNFVFAACEIKQDFADIISNVPTVDAVEMVRCRECFGRNCWEKDENGCDICWVSGLYVRGEDDYCPYGERKEGADNEL